MDAARHAEGEHEQRHHDQHGVHPVPPRHQRREAEADAQQRENEDEQGVPKRLERPPGEQEDHGGGRCAVDAEALGTGVVHRHVVDHGPGEVEIVGHRRGRPQQRVSNPGRRPAPVSEPRARERDDQAGLPTVRSDEHARESFDRGVAIERQRRRRQPVDRLRARDHRLKPPLTTGVARRRCARRGLDEPVDGGRAERASGPGGHDHVAAAKLTGKLRVGLPRWKRLRHPLDRRRRIDAENSKGRPCDPRRGEGQEHERARAHGKQPAILGGSPATAGCGLRLMDW